MSILKVDEPPLEVLLKNCIFEITFINDKYSFLDLDTLLQSQNKFSDMTHIYILENNPTKSNLFFKSVSFEPTVTQTYLNGTELWKYIKINIQADSATWIFD